MEREAVIPNFPMMASTVLMTDRSGEMRGQREVRERLLTDWKQEKAKSTESGRTVGDEDGQQAGCAAHSQEGQLGDLAGAVEGEQGDGACGHLHQTKDHLGQIDVHSKVRNVERQAVVHEHVGKPETHGEKEESSITLTELHHMSNTLSLCSADR